MKEIWEKQTQEYFINHKSFNLSVLASKNRLIIALRFINGF